MNAEINTLCVLWSLGSEKNKAGATPPGENQTIGLFATRFISYFITDLEPKSFNTLISNSTLG
jgi:hypothetical protein